MEEIINDFICETTEKLALLDQELLRLEQEPLDHAIVDNIFRMVHTIKGTSGFLGFERLGELAHAAENVLSVMRDGSLSPTPDIVDAILKTVDTIKEMMSYLAEHLEEPKKDNDALILLLNNFLSPNESMAETIDDNKDSSSDHNQTEQSDEVHQEELSEQHAIDENAPPAISDEKPSQENADAHISNDTNSPPIATHSHDISSLTPKTSAPSTANPANASIRVNIDILEKMMQTVSELVLNRNQLMQLLRTQNDAFEPFQVPLQQLSYITTELQERVMKTRMQPIGNAWSQLPRLVRDLSHDLGKKINLVMSGEETELDRQLLETIKDPLTHMVRNSCDHGIEMPNDRIASGKKESGTVHLSSYHEGGHIVIKIEDDGRGLNLERIKRKAIENNIHTNESLNTLSRQQIMQLIFHPGFSTAEKVTSVSGRGVGMDVVQTNIQKMGGSIELISEEGKGSQFYIKIPLTLAIVSVIIVESHAQKFALPQLNVQEIVTICPENPYTIETIDNAKILRLRGELLPLVSLAEILNLPPLVEEKNTPVHIVICKSANNRFGLIVDSVHDTEEIVVKPVTFLLKDFPLFSGNTILGDGSVIMILDTVGIVKTIPRIDGLTGKENKDDIFVKEKTAEDIGFILFKDSSLSPKAVPLELVSRIEKIDAASIEHSGDVPIVQYRDGIMRIINSDPNFDFPEDGLINIVVFIHDEKNVGLLIREIDDIVYTPYDIKFSSSSPFSLGSLIIEGVTTDIIDVSAIFDAEIPKERKLAISIEKSNQRPINILLVEDSPLFSTITDQFLKTYGYEIKKAFNGVEAINILMTDPKAFDGIVTDIDMPVMDGCVFTHMCRSNPDLKDLPIIAYTGFVEKNTTSQYDHVGFNACLSKTDRTGLISAIEMHIINNKKRQETDNAEIELFSFEEKDEQNVLLALNLKDQCFGLPVSYVRDVLKDPIFPAIPNISKEILSFINLRGRVVTILNMKEILNYENKEYEAPMLVVIDYKGEYFGLLVDDVEEVMTLNQSEIEPTPPNLSERWSGIFTGVYQRDQNILGIMNMEALFNAI